MLIVKVHSIMSWSVGHSPVVGGIFWKALKDVCHKVKRVNLLPGFKFDSTVVKSFPNLHLK